MANNSPEDKLENEIDQVLAEYDSMQVIQCLVDTSFSLFFWTEM